MAFLGGGGTGTQEAVIASVTSIWGSWRQAISPNIAVVPGGDARNRCGLDEKERRGLRKLRFEMGRSRVSQTG
jgi:hypothetical protein